VAYIDQSYLVQVVSAVHLRTIVSNRQGDTSPVDLEAEDTKADIGRAILVAEGEANSILGRRFSQAELEALEASESEVLRHAVARLAVYALAPTSMARSDELRADADRARSLLKRIAAREASAGPGDSDPPPEHSTLINTVGHQGLDGMGRF